MASLAGAGLGLGMAGNPVALGGVPAGATLRRRAASRRWLGGALLLAQAALVAGYLFFVYTHAGRYATRHAARTEKPPAPRAKHAAHPPPPLAPEPDAERAARELAHLRIKAVAADTGSWNSIEAVVGLAAHGGAAASVHFSGACARLVRQGRLAVKRPNVRVILDGDGAGADIGGHRQQPLEAHVSDRDDPHDVLLVAASASKEGTAASARAICVGASARRRKSGAPAVTLFVEDRYASALATLAAVEADCGPAADRIHTFLAADDTAKRVLAENSAYTGRVAVVGAPMYDEDVRRRRNAAAAAAKSGVPAALAADGLLPDEWRRRGVLRRLLRMHPSRDVLVLVAGQTTGTGQIVDAVCHGLKRFFGAAPGAGGRVGRLLLLEHPRAPPGDRAAAAAARARCTAAHDVNLTGLGLGAADSAALLAMRSEEWLPVADVIASGYSTTNFYGMLNGRSGVVYMQVPDIVEQFRRDKHLAEVPEVAARAALSASDGPEFAAALELVLWSRLRGDPRAAHLPPWWPDPGDGAAALARLDAMLGRRAALLGVHDGGAAGRVASLMAAALGV